MEELSPNLAIEIQMCTYKEMLVNVSFFREFTADVIHRLVMSLESKMFMPKDYVISVGECGTDMFFIEYGKCEVFLNHVHVRTLTKNSYFGEIALITDVRRTASVQVRRRGASEKRARASERIARSAPVVQRISSSFVHSTRGVKKPHTPSLACRRALTCRSCAWRGTTSSAAPRR